MRVIEVGEESAIARRLAGSVRVGEDLRVGALELRVPELLVAVPSGAPRGALLTAASRIPGVRLVSGESGDWGLMLTGNVAGDSLRVVGLGGTERLALPVGGDAEAAGRLTAFVVKERNAAAMRTLVNPVRPFAVGIRPGNGSPRFRLGAAISVEVRSGRDGYLTLVDIGTDGELTVLYPNADTGPVPISAGGTRVFPEQGFEIRAGEPAGLGMLVAVVTPKPLSLQWGPEGFARVRLPEDLVKRVAEAVPAGPEWSGAGPGFVTTDVWGWSSAQMVYEVSR